MGKWILAPYLRKYLGSKDLTGYDKENQTAYNKIIRDRVGLAFEDLRLIFLNEDKIAFKQETKKSLFEKNISKKIREFVEAFLEPKSPGYNDYINDYRAYQRATDLLEILHGALNKILVPQKIQDIKLMSNPSITRNRYTNIAALEMMFFDSDLEKRRNES